MEHQTSQMESGGGDLLDRVQIPSDSAIFKGPDISAAADGGTAGQGNPGSEADVLGNLDLSQMDPEVIRVRQHQQITSLLYWPLDWATKNGQRQCFPGMYGPLILPPVAYAAVSHPE